MKDLAGKTAFVTGAASGIGLGIASALAQAGVKVMLCDIEEAALAAALEKLRSTNADVEGVRADISLKGELAGGGRGHCRALRQGPHPGQQCRRRRRRDLRQVERRRVGLDAGRQPAGRRRGIEIFGPLIERHGEGGHIVSTASIAGLISGGSIAYNVSKYGVVALSEGVRPGTGAPRHRRLGAVPGVHPHPDRRFSAASCRSASPARSAGRRPTGPVAERIKSLRDRVAQGIDPLYVGELVREGIENDWPYIFTDNEHEPFVEARFAAIKEGFNQIRGRIPRR